MTQTLYVHMNKKKNVCISLPFSVCHIFFSDYPIYKVEWGSPAIFHLGCCLILKSQIKPIKIYKTGFVVLFSFNKSSFPAYHFFPRA
jgi:hypothetical protein